MKHEEARLPAWAGQRDATVEQRALQVEAELRRYFGGAFHPRFRHELRQALAATWNDGEAAGERTHLQPAQRVGVLEGGALLQHPGPLALVEPSEDPR